MAVRLELHVADASDGAPVPGAAVRVNERELADRFFSDEAGLARIELAEKPEHLGIRVRCPGFVPRLVVWDLQTVRQPWPETYTLKLERAHTIGGLVRNEQGGPVVNAHVLVTLRGGSRDGVQPRLYNDIYDWVAKTDAQGRWQFPHAPANCEHIRVRLAHPDYISRHYQQPQVPAEDFQRGTAVLTIPSGIPCEGTVTDEHGQPIAGAKVILGEGGNGSDVKDSRRTDAQGRFRFGGISFDNYGEPQILSFQKKGYAPELITLQPSATIVRAGAVLRPGNALRLRFTDANGAPVPGVYLAMHAWRSHRPFHCCFHADENGLAVWENAPPDAAQFSIIASGFQREELLLAPTDDIQAIVLKRPLHVSGHVIDARTRQPIPHFSLIHGRDYPARARTSILWNHAWVYPYENGEYRVNAGWPVKTHNRDGTVSEEGFHRYRISAPGYKPAISRSIANDETEDIVCDFELEPAEDIAGVVCDAQGHPVAAVDIAVAAGHHSVILSDGSVRARASFAITTDTEGRYNLPPQEEDFVIVMAHPQAGYRITSCAALKAAPDVDLLPWGRVELRTTAAAARPHDYRLQEHLERDKLPPFHFSCKGNMQAGGLVVFECVVGGRVTLYAPSGPSICRDPIIVGPGQTTRIDLRTGRRSVIGRIELPAEGVSADPHRVQIGIHRRLPPRFTFTPENRRELFHGEIELDLQGNFRLDDVPVGPCMLSGQFFRSRPVLNAQPEAIAHVRHEFDLPPGDGPFDLGFVRLLPPSEWPRRPRGPDDRGPA